jgi:cytochrome c oxidase assembly factor CtaG
VSPDASWSISPGPIVLLTAATVAYLVRWRRAGEPWWRAALFLAGILCVAAALLSPIDRLGEQLFLMHMTQHLLLLDFAPILILFGLTKKILRPVTRRTVSLEKRAGWFGTPTFAITLYVVTMWIWHIPALYDGALENSFVHVAEHFSFAIAGGLYWWHVFSPVRPRHRLLGLGAAGYMASTKVFVGLLGVFLTFASDSFYAFYERQPRYWGLSPAEDQAVGGAIMALEQMIVMGAAFAFLFIRMLTEADRGDERTERYGDGASGEAAVPRVRAPLAGREAREDLARQGVALREGLRVRLVDGDAEQDAVAHWDPEWGGWVAAPADQPSSTAPSPT